MRDATPQRPDLAPIAKSPPAPDPPPPVLHEARIVRPVPPNGGAKVRFEPARPVLGALSARTPGLDRATASKLRKGERRPDARLDLHGMRLDAAHDALIRFVHDSRARGRRLVLVITGKGGDYRRRARGPGFEMPDEVGALRRMVPLWLDDPALRGAITGVFQAHPRHGGDGALYVYLRKPA